MIISVSMSRMSRGAAKPVRVSKLGSPAGPLLDEQDFEEWWFERDGRSGRLESLRAKDSAPSKPSADLTMSLREMAISDLSTHGECSYIAHILHTTICAGTDKDLFDWNSFNF